MNAPAAHTQQKPFSNALGMICGVVVGALYSVPLHRLTLDYFMQQIEPVIYSLGYQVWSTIWLVILFIAIVTTVRCAIVTVVTLVSHIFTSLIVRLSLPRQPRR